jgi:ribosomal protein S12 methylthiotransferase
MFDSAGYKATFDEDGFKGGSVVINTCGFIGDAKEESVNMIIEAINAKNEGLVDKVFVMGCLAERYSQELPAELPEVDGWYGKFDWTKIINDLSVTVPDDVPAWERILSTPSHHAYVKIAEGCNRFCAFCAIPLITGRYQSRPIEEILDEVTSLVARGVSEFNILAQDLSYYGHDIYGKSALAELIDRMAGLQGVHRIRLHYAYPADFPYDVLPVMARHKNVCKYLDIALQHISDKVLDNMRRHINGEETRQLLARIRKEVPGIHIRTTLMVGFPGEGEAEFEELKDFVREQRFERMGAFAYCEEEDTYAAGHFEDSIPEDVKQERLDEIMAIQEEIALESNRSKVGKTLEVVIDSENDEYYVGRTEFDSPEVDPEVLITKTKKLKIGEYYNVQITSAETFELFGIPV